VHAKIVVLAAGAIHTPAVLLRSGIRNPHVGRNLHLHPTTAAYARYEQPVRSWRGVPQSRVCEHFADLDGQGHGVRLEVAPAHPGLWGMALPWDSPRSHRRQMQQLPHLGNVIVLTRDRHGGRVRIDGQGRPVIDYSVHRDDARHMSRGVVEALRIQRAAGALEVFSPHHHDYACGCGDEQALEAWLQRVARQPIVKHSFGLFSAHQMSSCRLAGRREQGAVRPDGESWDVANLYVADASLMPTACGVNPMITIMGLAHHVAQHVKLRLG
jgi:choline dehydrogenase-like flavoprotein